MAVDKTSALAQIDAVIARRNEVGNRWYSDTVSEITTLTRATIARLVPPGSPYVAQIQEIFANTERSVGRTKEEEIECRLNGVLLALRTDYDAGRMQSFQELVHADLFSDFLEMAEYFLEEGYKDPAAVMSGGVLEEHLRKLSQKQGITLPPKPKLDSMNAELARVAAYGKNDQKQVTAWAGLRNCAAHGDYGKYTEPEVRLMVAGIREFIARNPA